MALFAGFVAVTASACLSGTEALDDQHDDDQQSPPWMDPGNPQDPGDDHGDNPDDWDSPGPGDGDCDYCNVPRPTALRLDLTAAVGLAVVSEGDGARGRSLAAGAGRVIRFDLEPDNQLRPDGDEDGGGGDGDDPGTDPEDGEDKGEDDGEEDDLLKLDDDGELEPAVEETTPEGAEDLTEEEMAQMWDPGPIPRISALGLSPDGSVYVLYEHAFVYRMVDPEDADGNVDIWSPSSPYTCQLFRSTATWDSLSHPDADTVGDLECVTNQHQIASWRADRVLQFDKDGNVYFPAIVADSWREVFYRYEPTAATLDEKVNANICWYDVQVTPIGSVFYTGASSTDGDCNGTSFFRYISSDNKLTEIARDWWDFKYLSEQDPDDPANERIIFYGPDPNYDGDWGWESACIYRYDPSIDDPASRTSRIATCGNGGWEYVWGDMNEKSPDEVTAADRLAFKERCEAEGDLFIGGEGVSELSQAKDGTIFVAGSFRMKTAGEFSCSVKFEADHCSTVDPTHSTQEVCEGAGGDWVLVGERCTDPAYIDDAEQCWENGASWIGEPGPMWYGDQSGTACSVTDDPDAADPDAGVHHYAGWTVDWVDCRTQGGDGDFTDSVDGFALLYMGDDDNDPIIELVSDIDEDVEAFWAVNGDEGTRFYYSTYAYGQYNLRTAYLDEQGQIERRTILEDYEVYNVMRDPANDSRILFDGLYFANNSYMFGSIDATLGTPEEVLASLELVQGYTGKIDTLIIFPSW